MAQISGFEAGKAKLIGSFRNYVEIYFAVSGAATFYVGVDRASLETPSAIPGGLPFNQANTSPPYKLTWIGDLWVIASAAGSVIEVTSPLPPEDSVVAPAS